MRVASIVCPGPSLDPSIVPVLHEQSDMVVAVNRGFRAWKDYPNLHPHMVYVVDGPHAWERDELPEIKALDRSVLVTRAERSTAADWRRIIDCHRRVVALGVSCIACLNDDPFLGDDLKRPLKGTLIAWQHLVRLGYSVVAIAGCDCFTTPHQRYWYDNAPTDDFERRQALQRNASANSSYDQVYRALRTWLPYGEAHGTETVNLSGEASRLSELMPSIAPTEIAAWAMENMG